MAIIIAVMSSIIMFSVVPIGNSLSLNYYEKTCPDLEFIAARVVREATSKDKTVPAALLRMHFHDCFIRVMTLRIPPHFLPSHSVRSFYSYTSSLTD